MGRHWTRYTEVENPTKRQQRELNEWGAAKRGKGKTDIHVLAQTDECIVYGYECRTGELLVTEAGYCYQAATSFYDDLQEILAKYDEERIPDAYAQGVVVTLPADARKRRNMIAEIERLTEQKIREYDEKHPYGRA
jgi:hypothetical protein